ncbi:adenylate kinase 7 isoform X1 [Gadus morhua]|uniref:adenylate kinase 7 isoform X1 n=2 Tax=Gadus morhua TaxID=8049 RepID=UPI0011B4493A|nr:adenylate kinase 7-like isoform X1 [Gadus morhua]XP_030211679.1 adenylate kinase 7-like isoform X1 [Gadus morhua]XP_030211681.1 adenylate kinase 7-like isoform X1 [Gadus morhua]XP_030211682.1 adenylate kinase 7-like isoform X1 [Gadus morhua]XP_030211683.1 adenylate kinase 7-like isoform X1 [Gadus morhua]XP_030211684.1 adenylate kinase 7-like isoform X1 [Gadus morhua]XP_030211685.1 adenylate kinase 7-like isoform X1 [Gadus morhua]XP_030211686.1 adenylate kinase 7-like isoform X1 [Gadus mor
MAEQGVTRTKRVFINNLDLYSSNVIAKFLYSYGERAPLVDDGQTAPKEYDELTEASQSDHNNKCTFEIVGTVTGKSGTKRPHVLEEYDPLQRGELLDRLMDCDVIVFNVSEQAAGVDDASWAVSELHRNIDTFDGPKIFILISSVMTWALSRPLADDPELPFTDEDYRKRRAHPNFKKHIDLEKLVVKMGKTRRRSFCTYVVASGLQYGMGEQAFHPLFKMSWVGEEPLIPVFGGGANVLPTIHIHDLASVIQNVIHLMPKPCYLLAVDNSQYTLEDIVKSIALVLGPRETQNRPFEEAFLIADFTQMELDSLSADLRLEAVCVKELLPFRWECEAGMVDSMELLVEQYRTTRGLLPVRVCILGPPAVGKSSLARRLCRQYRLNHVTVQTVVSQSLAHLEAAVERGGADPEARGSAAEAQRLLETLKENMQQNEGRLEEQYLLTLMKDRLTSESCRNQGFVLDGFPKTQEQASRLFSAEEDESEDSKSKMAPNGAGIIPDFLFCLDASDCFLKQRVMNLPQSAVQGTSYTYDRFPQRLARYRENQALDGTALHYFNDLDILPHHIEITDPEDGDYLLAVEQVVRAVGPPRHYGPSSQELAEVEAGARRRAEEELTRRAQARAEEERQEEEEEEQRARRWEQWRTVWGAEQDEARGAGEAEERAARRYLLEHVMPTLSPGLLLLCTQRPEHPADFLAEYLFTNNPMNY